MNRLIRGAVLVTVFFGLAIHGFSVPSVSLYYRETAQVELISSNGTRVLIDISNPSRLSRPATRKDILLTTHTHPDHINNDFLSAFKGKQLFCQTGQIKVGGISIRGIASAHNEGDQFLPEQGTNYIYVVDMDGLRIVHFGDIGQNALTSEQLSVLGKVDVAITQFDNPYSDMNVDNKKGFNLMIQLKPRLIVPTHNSTAAAKYMMTVWPCFYSEQPSVKINRDNLTQQTRVLFMGDLATGYAAITQASSVDW